MILVEDGLRCHESFKNNLYEKPSRTENSFTLSVIYRGPWFVSELKFRYRNFEILPFTVLVAKGEH